MPQSEAKERLSEGWPILLAAMVGIATGVGAVPFYAIGPFMIHLESEFGWSRTEISSALTALAVALFIATPIAGRMCDLHAPRRIAIFSTLLFAPLMAALSLLGDAIVGLIALFALLGFLGAGTGPVTYTRIIAARFDKRRGLALGIALTGTGIAGFMVPLIVQNVSEVYGWRAAWIVLACCSLASLPVLILGLRNSAATQRVDKALDGLEGGSIRELIGYQFIILGLCLFLISLFVAGFIVHLIPMLTDAGIPAAEAARTAAIVGISVIVGRLGVGWAVDRFHGPFVAAIVFSCTAVGCWLLAFAGPELAMLAAALFGIALGAEVDLIAYMVSRYFPMRRYGQVYGWQYAFYVSGAALSPILVGTLRDAYFSYEMPLQVGAATIFIAAMLFLTLGRYPSEEGLAQAKS